MKEYGKKNSFEFWASLSDIFYFQGAEKTYNLGLLRELFTEEG